MTVSQEFGKAITWLYLISVKPESRSEEDLRRYLEMNWWTLMRRPEGEEEAIKSALEEYDRWRDTTWKKGKGSDPDWIMFKTKGHESDSYARVGEDGAWDTYFGEDHPWNREGKATNAYSASVQADRYLHSILTPPKGE